MAKFDKFVITDLGRSMIADSQASAKTINITYCKTSSHNYYNDDLSILTALDDIEQSVLVSGKSSSGDTIKLESNLTNQSLALGYDFYTYGIYANNGSGDILFAVGVSDTADSIPAGSEAPWQTIIHSFVTISNAPNITVNVDLAANATMEWVNENKLINVTYSEIKGLRDNSQLVAGQQYRITDYETIINGDVTYNGETKTIYRSAGHQFDIIVVADDVNVLNENARAAVHAGDTYFTNCDLSVWKLKYCIDNDTSRFNWAINSGKGVIWGMEDEFCNCFPYDFKNIQMKRFKVLTDTDNICVGAYLGTYDYNLDVSPFNTTLDESDFVWVYTLSNISNNSDLSLTNSANNNRLVMSSNESGLLLLNNIVYSSATIADCVFETQLSRCITFVSLGSIIDIKSSGSLVNAVSVAKSGMNSMRYMRFDGFSYNFKFGAGCSSNTFGCSCHTIVMGENDTFNSFGNNCSLITLGSACHSNSFGNTNYNNVLGNSCATNSFGNACSNISVGNNSVNNSFGNRCDTNSFGTISNSRFGNTCIHNTFNNTSSDNLDWADGCSNNTVSNTVGSFYAVTMEDNCNNNTFNRSGNQGNIYLGNSVNHCNIGAGVFSVVKANKASTTWTSANDGQVITS